MIPVVSTKELANNIKLQCNKFILEQHDISKLLSKSKEIDKEIEEAKKYLKYVEEQRNIEQIEITKTEIDNLTNKKIELEKRYYNSKIYIKLKKIHDESNEKDMKKFYIHSNIDWDKKLHLGKNTMSKIKSKNPKINLQDIPWFADFFEISVEELTFGNFENYVRLCFETPTFEKD